MAVTDLRGLAVRGNAVGKAASNVWATAPTVDGDLINPGDTLVVLNSGASPVNVVADSYATDNGVVMPDAGGAVAAGLVRVFRFSGDQAQPADGDYPGAVLVTYSTPADVRRTVVR